MHDENTFIQIGLDEIDACAAHRSGDLFRAAGAHLHSGNGNDMSNGDGDGSMGGADVSKRLSSLLLRAPPPISNSFVVLAREGAIALTLRARSGAEMRAWVAYLKPRRLDEISATSVTAAAGEDPEAAQMKQAADTTGAVETAAKIAEVADRAKHAASEDDDDDDGDRDLRNNRDTGVRKGGDRGGGGGGGDTAQDEEVSSAMSSSEEEDGQTTDAELHLVSLSPSEFSKLAKGSSPGEHGQMLELVHDDKIYGDIVPTSIEPNLI